MAIPQAKILYRKRLPLVGLPLGPTLQRKAHTGRPTVTFKTTPTEIFEYNIEDNIEHMMALGYPCRFNYLIKNPGTITDRVFGNNDNVSKLVLTTDELLASDKYIQRCTKGWPGYFGDGDNRIEVPIHVRPMLEQLASLCKAMVFFYDSYDRFFER